MHRLAPFERMAAAGWLAPLLIGVAVALALACIGQALFKPSRHPAPFGDHASWTLRLWGRLLAQAATRTSPWLAPTRRLRIERQLAQSGLRVAMAAVHLHGAQWLALLSALAAAVFLVAVARPAPVFACLLMATGAMAGWSLPGLWLRERIRQRRAAVLRALPFMLDMTTLCVEAGLNLSAALREAAQKGPEGPLRDELQHLQADLRTGVPRAQALRDMAERLDEPAMKSLVGTLIQADSIGMNLAPILRAQSDQRRTERFLRAEKAAMEAPVKMLLPLVACIFPCTFVVIGFPIAYKLLETAW